MKTKLSKLFCLLLALSLCLCSCQPAATEPEATPEPEAPAPVETVYTATAGGFGGDVTATVKATDGVITGAEVVGANETPGFGADAITVFNDALKALTGVNTADAVFAVDAVSGATATSNAVNAALSDIAAQISGVTAEAKLTDGTYTSKVWGFSLTNTLSVATTIEGGKLTTIVPDVENSGETDQIIQTAIDCMIPRIIDEQSLAVDAVSGATASSNAIKLAVRDALTQSMSASGMGEGEIAAAVNSFYKAPSYLKNDAAAVEMNVDVVVVGAGGTGCLAALESANMGADTLVIETSGKYGGTGALTCGPMAVNSPQQVKENGGIDLVDEQLLFDTWFADAHTKEGETKATLISEYSKLSGYTIDWMHEMGFEKFTQAITFKYPQFRVWTMYPGWNAGKVHGAGLTHGYFNNLMAKYEELGGKTMFETTGVELILNGGAVTGVRAVGWDGQTYDITAKSVVLATGGYAGNEEMLREYTKGEYQLYGVSANKGTAISMGKQVDAKLADNIDIVMAHFSAPSKRIHMFDATYNQVPTALALNQFAMDVNTTGDRFISETAASDDAGDETARYYAVWGGDAVEAIKANGFAGTTNGMYMNPGKIEAGTPLPELDKVIDAGVELGFIFKADTIEGLTAAIAEKTGFPMTNLPAAVDKYNAICEAGNDTDFGKPAQFLQAVTGDYFIAVEVAPIMYSTCSSLEVDTEMRVMTNAGTPVQNLYAAGTDTMGMLLFDEYTDYGGCAQAWAFTSGRIAGANAALYAVGATDVTEETKAAAAKFYSSEAFAAHINEGTEITKIDDTTFRLFNSAPMLPSMAAYLGDKPENGVNYVVLKLDAPAGANAAELVFAKALDGDGAETAYGRLTPVADGAALLPVQLNTTSNTCNGLALNVKWDNGTETTYALYADLVIMGDETLMGDDMTAQTVEAAAKAKDTEDVNCVNLGLAVLAAGKADGAFVYELTGSVPLLPAMTDELDLQTDGGDNYGVLFLEAPEGFEGKKATIVSEAPFGAEAVESGKSKNAVTLDDGTKGIAYVIRFVPGVTLVDGGMKVKVDWNGTVVDYSVLYNGLALGTTVTDMGAALEKVDADDRGVDILATAPGTWTISGKIPEGGVNVLIEAPNLMGTYSALSIDGVVTENPLTSVVMKLEIASGQTVAVNAVWTTPASFWSGPVNYPVTYTFTAE